MIAHDHNIKAPERNPTFLFQRVVSKTLISKTLATGTANRYCQQVLPTGVSKTLTTLWKKGRILHRAFEVTFVFHCAAESKQFRKT